MTLVVLRGRMLRPIDVQVEDILAWWSDGSYV